MMLLLLAQLDTYLKKNQVDYENSNNNMTQRIQKMHKILLFLTQLSYYLKKIPGHHLDQKFNILSIIKSNAPLSATSSAP